ncbi:MAG: hypothetical protein JRH18_17030 [Deltaproteobacteria bacterium]|nr:hypothetical protein [Deltaproteobacteria bacterium]MBW1961035.1 hypothetical protein [Deltaproteobacteria bacterium]MBW2153362.1 hypothetical protein [Deltaproteobacteria bacterium]
MKWFLYGMGFLWIGVGICLILLTDMCRKAIARILDAIHEKILAVFSLAVGFLLVLSAFWSQNFWFIMMLGTVAIAKGVLLMFNPKNLFERMKDWYLNSASDNTYRLFGIIMLIVGTVISSWT